MYDQNLTRGEKIGAAVFLLSLPIFLLIIMPFMFVMSLVYKLKR